mgnify:CR=1 FL=1
MLDSGKETCRPDRRLLIGRLWGEAPPRCFLPEQADHNHGHGPSPTTQGSTGTHQGTGGAGYKRREVDGHRFEGRHEVLDNADRVLSGPTASTRLRPRSQRPRTPERARADRKARENRGAVLQDESVGPGVENKMGAAFGTGPPRSAFNLIGPAPGTRILIGHQMEGPQYGFR